MKSGIDVDNILKQVNGSPFNFIQFKTKEELRYILYSFYGIRYNSEYTKSCSVEQILRGFYNNLDWKVDDSSYGFNKGSARNWTEYAFHFCIKSKNSFLKISSIKNRKDLITDVDLIEWTIMIDILLSTVSAIESVIDDKSSLHEAIKSCNFHGTSKNYHSYLGKKLTLISNDQYLSGIIGLNIDSGVAIKNKKGVSQRVKVAYKLDKYQQSLICNLARNYNFFKDFSSNRINDFNRIIKYYNETIEYCPIKEISLFERIYNIRLIYDIFIAVEAAIKRNSLVNIYHLIDLFTKARYIPAPFFRSYFITESVRALSFGNIKASSHYNRLKDPYLSLTSIHTLEAESSPKEIETIWHQITEFSMKYYMRFVIPIMKAQLLYFLLDNFHNDYKSMYSYLTESELYRAITEKNFHFKNEDNIFPKASKDCVVKYVRDRFASKINLQDGVDKNQLAITSNNHFANIKDCITYIMTPMLSDLGDYELLKNQLKSDWILNPRPEEKLFVSEALKNLSAINYSI